MEVPDKLVLGMYVVYFLCNLTLVLQIVIYWKKTEEQIRKNQVLFVCLTTVIGLIGRRVPIQRLQLDSIQSSVSLSFQTNASLANGTLYLVVEEPAIDALRMEVCAASR